MAPTISLKSVSKSYGTGPLAVDNLDLVMPARSFTCLLGPSGCGKTTTLRMIAGLENLTDGSITIGDRIVDSVPDGVFVPPEKRGLGLVFQNYALWPHLTVRANVEFGLRLRKIGAAERRRVVDKALATMQIDGAADRYPSQLSGGQQQRVSLARMLAVNPEVLLLDEPLSNLDARLRLEMRAELKRLHDETGHTVVFVTHDQLEAMTMATHVAVMKDGVLHQLAPPLEVYHRPANTFVAAFVGSPPMNLVGTTTALGARLRASLGESAGISTVGVRPEHVRVLSGPPRDHEFSFDAKVKAVLPTGASWTVSVLADETELYLVSAEPVTAHRGEVLRCAVAAGNLHAFDAEGSRLALESDPEQEPEWAS
ncbi:ABC transporter ATP-binding protein [Amycolatopsis jejuensis]|uniref:ABC transporter ATP-binding protein n=1 Tax=Amycolatopsis jejuensis TaxID=330084 RepID=UPI000525E0BB|nr:ABC transporter ATP-binding protein [Amycolatopsis jejuensis]